MARRAEPHRSNEPEGDAWSETWGDRALQDLGRRLVSYGLADEQAARIVEQTWLFYSYVALPELHERLPLGIAAEPTESLPAVFFYLTFRSPEDSHEQNLGNGRFRVVQESFSRELAAPLADLVNLYLEEFPTSQPYRALHDPEAFEFVLRLYTISHRLDYVGVFVDDLEAELRTVMDPESVPLWLETPNVIFGGRKPAELLDDPLDRQLRDVITRAKFNLPAA